MDWREDVMQAPAAGLVVRSAGRGAPLLVLHEELGDPGPLGWQEDLGAERELLLPLHPGFGRTPRVEWIGGMRDLACFYAAWLRSRRLVPVDLIGFSFGGWLAAEMMANDPGLIRRAILVAPPGIRPARGEIFDLFTLTARRYVEATVADRAKTPEFATLFGGERTPEQFEAWEDARAEVARLAWQPYLYNPSLPRLLELVSVPPTLLVWGREDPIVPLEVGEAYARAMAGSRLVVLEGVGHRPEIERRDALVRAVREFLGAAPRPERP